MGLDMYLERRTRVYNFNGGTYEYTEHGVEIGYWRKFNALHGYIVENFANGVDECQPIHLYKERIEEVLAILKIVQRDHDKAPLLLPSVDGFFFGGTEYDEWYFNRLDDAVEIFERALAETDFSKSEVVYQASW